MTKSDKVASAAADYSATLFLPQTDFPMRAGLPKKEPELLTRWAADDLQGRMRAGGEYRSAKVLRVPARS